MTDEPALAAAVGRAIALLAPAPTGHAHAHAAGEPCGRQSAASARSHLVESAWLRAATGAPLTRRHEVKPTSSRARSFGWRRRRARPTRAHSSTILLRVTHALLRFPYLGRGRRDAAPTASINSAGARLFLGGPETALGVACHDPHARSAPEAGRDGDPAGTRLHQLPPTPGRRLHPTRGVGCIASTCAQNVGLGSSSPTTPDRLATDRRASRRPSIGAPRPPRQESASLVAHETWWGKR